MKTKLRQGGFPLPDESIPDFLERIGTEYEREEDAA